MNNDLRMVKLARHVAGTIEDGTAIGLGSGSTAEAFVAALGERVAGGLHIRAVSTSERTTRVARDNGITLVDPAEHMELDIGVDGADEIDPSLDLVKGRGGALLYEKIVAETCRTWMIVASAEKLVNRLGTRLPLPVEVVPFGWQRTATSIRRLGLEPHLRVSETGKPFLTDGGHLILDCQTNPIEDAPALAQSLKQITGVVDHGLFIGIADLAVTIDADGEIALHYPAGNRSR